MDSPSLAIRPAEAAAAIDAAQPAATVTPIIVAERVPLEAATLARLEVSMNAARASVAPFAKAAEPARAAVASAAGASVNSEAWVAAQVAISRLERTREASANALAEVDGLRRELVESGKNFDRDTFAAMQNIVSGIDSDQRAQVSALLNSLKSH
ncbi:MAG: hypothetical protein AABY88_11460 [Pseudomonadota bacterium]